MIISFVNQKGGVGKTTSTQAVATALAQKGKKVLAVDFDPQGNLGVVEGIALHELEYTMSNYIADKEKDRCNFEDVVVETSGYHLIPSMIYLSGLVRNLSTKMNWGSILKQRLEPIKDFYDFILIDCPPNLEFLTINALAASDYVGFISESSFISKLALEGLEDTMKQVQEQLNPNLKKFGVIITKVDMRTNHSKDNASKLEELYKDIYTFRIPISVKVADSQEKDMQSIVLSYPEHKSAKAYVEVADALIKEAMINE